MPVLKVLLDSRGKIVGTARTDFAATGKNGPESSTLVARRGQRLIEVTISDDIARLEPSALHAAIKKKRLSREKK